MEARQMPRLWTNAQRQDAARRAKINAPWNHSTGPRTAAGKAISSRNSYKHGRYSYERHLLRWYVRLAAMRLKRLDAAINHVAYDHRNEVIAKYFPHRAKTPDIMGFYPYFKVHPLDSPPKRRKPQTETGGTLKTQAEVERYFDSLSRDADDL